jgi:hypothetical protein
MQLMMIANASILQTTVNRGKDFDTAEAARSAQTTWNEGNAAPEKSYDRSS